MKNIPGHLFGVSLAVGVGDNAHRGQLATPSFVTIEREAVEPQPTSIEGLPPTAPPEGAY